jgi:hypothetical protein
VPESHLLFRGLLLLTPEAAVAEVILAEIQAVPVALAEAAEVAEAIEVLLLLVQ